jgi:hypothetical protein
MMNAGVTNNFSEPFRKTVRGRYVVLYGEEKRGKSVIFRVNAVYIAYFTGKS